MSAAPLGQSVPLAAGATISVRAAVRPRRRPGPRRERGPQPMRCAAACSPGRWHNACRAGGRGCVRQAMRSQWQHGACVRCWLLRVGRERRRSPRCRGSAAGAGGQMQATRRHRAQGNLGRVGLISRRLRRPRLRPRATRRGSQPRPPRAHHADVPALPCAWPPRSAMVSDAETSVVTCRPPGRGSGQRRHAGIMVATPPTGHGSSSPCTTRGSRTMSRSCRRRPCSRSSGPCPR